MKRFILDILCRLAEREVLRRWKRQHVLRLRWKERDVIVLRVIDMEDLNTLTGQPIEFQGLKLSIDRIQDRELPSYDQEDEE